MAIVLQRLQNYLSPLPSPYIGRQWAFLEALKQKDPSFFQPFIINHSIISLEYRLLCTIITNGIAEGTLRREQLEEALMLAELLEHLYVDYLDVPREVYRLRREKTGLRMLLRFPTDLTALPPAPVAVGQKIREYSALINPIRLGVGRSRRLILAVAEGLQSHEISQNIELSDQYLRPIMVYFSWVFFGPRLLVNLISMGKHVIPGPWMSEKEQKIDLAVRFQAQLPSRWFLLSNDAVWFVAGLLNCFVFIGVLAPWAIYFSLAFQAYDVFLILLRIHIDNQRWEGLKKQYEFTNHENYYDLMQARIANENAQLRVGLINNVAILFTVTSCLPLFAGFALIPILGAFIGVTVTLYACIELYLLDKSNPAKGLNLDHIKGPGFFDHSLHLDYIHDIADYTPLEVNPI